MTPEDESLVRAQRLDALQRALGAHHEEGAALRDLQAAVGARDRDVLGELRQHEWEADDESFRRKMRRQEMLVYVLLALALVATWVEGFLVGLFGHPR